MSPCPFRITELEVLKSNLMREDIHELTFCSVQFHALRCRLVNWSSFSLMLNEEVDYFLKDACDVMIFYDAIISRFYDYFNSFQFKA